VRDLKIDVFDDIAVATYYPYVTYVLNGEEKKGSGRQTFVFLNTKDGWKLVHELVLQNGNNIAVLTDRRISLL
jgi:ketosteroid isomerase-like protein